MSLTTRPIINPGAELYAPGGAPLNDVRVECVLVGVDGNPCDVIDAITHEPVVGSAAAMIKNGLLPAADDPKALKLWPNNRGNKKTYYRCRVVTEGFGYFMTALVEGDTPLTWVEFVTNGMPLTAQELSALNLHIDDDAVHLKPAPENALKVPRINALGTGIEYVEDVGGGAIDGGSASSVYGGTTGVDGGNA